MADSKKTIVLITGANSGIGFELAAQLLADASKHVLLGSRTIEKGEAAVKELQSRKLPGSVELIRIDVADEESITAAAKKVDAEHGHLDALVNNAGIAFASGTMFQQLIECFRTNAAGAWATVEAFEPLLSKSGGTPRIINVSTGGGSIGMTLDPESPFRALKEPQYRVSKAAMNMVSACQTVEYTERGWKVLCYNPGFTESNLGPMNKVEMGAKPVGGPAGMIVKMVDGEMDGDVGKFLHHEFPDISW